MTRLSKYTNHGWNSWKPLASKIQSQRSIQKLKKFMISLARIWFKFCKKRKRKDLKLWLSQMSSNLLELKIKRKMECTKSLWWESSQRISSRLLGEMQLLVNHLITTISSGSMIKMNLECLRRNSTINSIKWTRLLVMLSKRYSKPLCTWRLSGLILMEYSDLESSQRSSQWLSFCQGRVQKRVYSCRWLTSSQKKT